MMTDADIDWEVDRDSTADITSNGVVFKVDTASCIASVIQSIALAEQEIAELTIQVGLHLNDINLFVIGWYYIWGWLSKSCLVAW